jgi:hypothetical protein
VILLLTIHPAIAFVMGLLVGALLLLVILGPDLEDEDDLP